MWVWLGTELYLMFAMYVCRWQRHPVPLTALFVSFCLWSFLSIPPWRQCVSCSSFIWNPLLFYSQCPLFTTVFVLWSHQDHRIKEYWTIAARGHTGRVPVSLWSEQFHPLKCSFCYVGPFAKFLRINQSYQVANPLFYITLFLYNT